MGPGDGRRASVVFRQPTASTTCQRYSLARRSAELVKISYAGGPLLTCFCTVEHAAAGLQPRALNHLQAISYGTRFSRMRMSVHTSPARVHACRTCNTAPRGTPTRPNNRQRLPHSDNRQKATSDAVVLAEGRQFLPSLRFMPPDRVMNFDDTVVASYIPAGKCATARPEY